MWADADSQASPSPSPSADASDLQDAPPDFNAPLSPRLWFSLEDELTPAYDDLKGSSNTINVRGQIPLGELGKQLPSPLLVPGRLQLIKFKVPFVTSAPIGAVKGNGDTTLVALEYLGVSERKWVAGPVLKIPTANADALGTGRWSGGPAVGYTYSHNAFIFGLYAQSFFSFAGPKARGGVSQTQFQPGVYFLLPHGWVIGNSQMQFTYNWQNNSWQDVPVGLRIARNSENSHHQLAIGFEVETNLANKKNTTLWTYRVNFKYRLLVH